MLDEQEYPPLYQTCGILQNQDSYIRLVTMINHATLELYYKIFHDSSEHGFSTDPIELNQQLKKYEEKLLKMKHDGELTQHEIELLFPAGDETYSQEFTIPLFHKLCKLCIFQLDENNNGVSDYKRHCMNTLNALEKILHIYTTDKLIDIDHDEFERIWNQIIEILSSINYDVSKLHELQNGLIDHKRFRFALIKTEITLLEMEVDKQFNTTKINTFAIEKLLMNQKEATQQYELEFKSDDLRLDDYPLRQLKDDIELTSKMLLTLKNNVKDIYPDMKYWREKNVEGDIIIIDEKLTKLKNQVNEQSYKVKNFFTEISLEIVKMKEKVNHQESNEQYVVSTLERSRSNVSLAHVKGQRTSALIK